MTSARKVSTAPPNRTGRPKAAKRLKRVNVSVDPVDYQALDELARVNGLSTAMLIRVAMKQFLVSHNDGHSVALLLPSGNASRA